MRDDEVAHIAELEAQCEVLRRAAHEWETRALLAKARANVALELAERFKRQRDQARLIAEAYHPNPIRWKP